MVTVWPLLAVTVAVAMVTTVWPAAMVLMRGDWGTLTGVGGSEGASPSEKRRRRAEPAGGDP